MPVPLTCLKPISLFEGRTPGTDLLAIAIADALPEHERDLHRLRTLLAEDVLRNDGRPCFIRRDGFTRRESDPVTFVLRKQRGIGAIGRSVLAAVYADLEGIPLGLPPFATREALTASNRALGLNGQLPDESVSALLGLSDHVAFSKGGEIDADPGKARKKRSAGRRLLSQLGFWPWAHVEQGRLPAGWRSQPTFLRPLSLWLGGVTDELEAQLERQRAMLARAVEPRA